MTDGSDRFDPFRHWKKGAAHAQAASAFAPQGYFQEPLSEQPVSEYPADGFNHDDDDPFAETTRKTYEERRKKKPTPQSRPTPAQQRERSDMQSVPVGHPAGQASNYFQGHPNSPPPQQGFASGPYQQSYLQNQGVLPYDPNQQPATHPYQSHSPLQNQVPMAQYSHGQPGPSSSPNQQSNYGFYPQGIPPQQAPQFPQTPPLAYIAPTFSHSPPQSFVHPNLSLSPPQSPEGRFVRHCPHGRAVHENISYCRDPVGRSCRVDRSP